MFERLLAFARVDFGNGALGKETQYGLMHIADATTFDGQADERGRDALGDRCHIVPRPPIVGMEVGIEHEATAANELDAVNGNLPFAYKVEHLNKRNRID